MSLLFSLTAILVLGLVVLLFRSKPQKSERVYRPKGPYLLSAGEKRFFDVLVHSIDENMYVCPKVRLADLITVDIPNSDPSFWRHLGPINQKHVDFIICSRTDFSPLVAVELDGGSHNETRRSERDTFVDSVFADARIPILHIPVRSIYYSDELRNIINSSLEKRASGNGEI